MNTEFKQMLQKRFLVQVGQMLAVKAFTAHDMDGFNKNREKVESLEKECDELIDNNRALFMSVLIDPSIKEKIHEFKINEFHNEVQKQVSKEYYGIPVCEDDFRL